MTDPGPRLVSADALPVQSADRLDKALHDVEVAHAEVVDELQVLRAQRAKINDRIRELVAQEVLLTRMVRVAKRPLPTD